MLKPFDPIIRASRVLPKKVRGLATASQGVKTRCLKDAQDVLASIHFEIGRLRAVGIPSVKEGYRGGSAGWEFDVGHHFSTLAEAAQELVDFAARVSPRPIRTTPLGHPQSRDLQVYEEQLREWTRAHQQVSLLASRFERHVNNLNRLQRFIAPPIREKQPEEVLVPVSSGREQGQEKDTPWGPSIDVSAAEKDSAGTNPTHFIPLTS
jgi:hypothetical protein